MTPAAFKSTAKQKRAFFDKLAHFPGKPLHVKSVIISTSGLVYNSKN